MMLKFFFWILLLANAGLLAHQRGAFDNMLSSGREPARMSQQINADKIRLIPPPEAKPAPDPQPAPPSAAPAASPEGTPADAKAPEATPVAAKTPEVAACTEIGNFNPEEARRFTALLTPLALGDRVSQRAVQEVASHMVFIPPQADKDGAEKKAGELRRLGVEDFFIIQDNSALRWGISLGVFKQEEAARAHLASLNQKGVRSARIGQRMATTNLVAFKLRGLDAAAKAALEKIKTGFAKQEMRACDGA